VRDDEIRAVPLERLDRAGRAGEGAGEGAEDTLAGQVGVLLGAGEGEFALDNPLGQDEPAMVVAAPREVLEGAEGVEAGEKRRR